MWKVKGTASALAFACLLACLCGGRPALGGEVSAECSNWKLDAVWQVKGYAKHVNWGNKWYHVADDIQEQVGGAVTTNWRVYCDGPNTTIHYIGRRNGVDDANARSVGKCMFFPAKNEPEIKKHTVQGHAILLISVYTSHEGKYVMEGGKKVIKKTGNESWEWCWIARPDLGIKFKPPHRGKNIKEVHAKKGQKPAIKSAADGPVIPVANWNGAVPL